MPRQQWSSKRECQYEHIKSSAKERGESEDLAEEIAARTVNKNRARSGKSKQASKASAQDMSPQQRGGKRSGRPGPRGQTRARLYAKAKRRGVKGRSNVSKRQLQDALNESPRDVRHIVLPHLDLDHAGGLADFPHSRILCTPTS